MAELALGGELRGVHGILPAALACRKAGRNLLVALPNVAEAALVQDLKLYAAEHVLQVCRHLQSRDGDSDAVLPLVQQHLPRQQYSNGADLADVRGQHHAKRALEIAAAGAHNLLLIGPPGTGKTMLASRLPTIMPPLSEAEAMASAAIASVSRQGIDLQHWGIRSFRAPHHTASGVALVGGGSQPRPGEISLAHHGVLFLDELPEFNRKVLEVLREPLESGRVTISRAARQAEFPAEFQLVAAMNPCPCGYLGDSGRHCACTSEQVRRYRARVSGPLLDRIDMHIEVPRIPYQELRGESREEASVSVRKRVIQARQQQQARAKKANAVLSSREVERFCILSASDYRLLEQFMQRLSLSPRAYHRILKVARTIADLAASESIQTTHLTEAISYRALDRGGKA